jgi:hypothetical protein
MTDAIDFSLEDKALKATDDEPVDEAKAAAFRRRLDRAAGMSSADAVKVRIRAERKRQITACLE